MRQSALKIILVLSFCNELQKLIRSADFLCLFWFLFKVCWTLKYLFKSMSFNISWALNKLSNPRQAFSYNVALKGTESYGDPRISGLLSGSHWARPLLLIVLNQLILKEQKVGSFQSGNSYNFSNSGIVSPIKRNNSNNLPCNVPGIPDQKIKKKIALQN
jgi:hypothetical protein